MSIKASILLLVGSTLLASCSTAAVDDARRPRAAQELASALAGRTAGKPVNCIPNYRANQMQIIDDETLLFRDGSTIYLQKTKGSCPGIASGANTLVTRTFGINQLCNGDIQRVVNLSSGIGGGSCVFGPFVPYTRR
jgi:hypothetical protein